MCAKLNTADLFTTKVCWSANSLKWQIAGLDVSIYVNIFCVFFHSFFTLKWILHNWILLFRHISLKTKINALIVFCGNKWFGHRFILISGNIGIVEINLVSNAFVLFSFGKKFIWKIGFVFYLIYSFWNGVIFDFD